MESDKTAKLAACPQPVIRWHCRHWHIIENSAAFVDLYRIAPHVHPPFNTTFIYITLFDQRYGNFIYI